MRARFHPALRLIHWTMAALILLMLFVGIGMVSTAGPAYETLIRFHRPLGIAILAIVVVRLVIRLATGAPALPADMPAPMKLVAKASHILLYAAMFAMPLIGWAMLSAGGYPVEIAKGLALPPIVPQDLRLFGLLRLAHSLVAFAFFALILAHLSAALVHALIRRDGVFEAMGFAPRRQ